MRQPNAEIIVSLELMRMILDLPAEYSIVAADVTSELRLCVHAPELTQPLPDKPLHLLTPIYRRARTGETELQELRITPAHER